MCGITGIIRFNSNYQKNEIKQMTKSIAHRGPDGQGFFIKNNIALGHRRLSIIDLKTGSQPMCNEDKTIWITLNGEIYNYLELRKILKQKGHIFKTQSDTEVVIHSYEQWGKDCVQHLRGMFAFGIADTKKRQLFIARDYIGIKPLVYYIGKNCFAFASEIQALQQIDNTKLDIDIQAIDQYLRLQYIPAPKTVFKQIKKLPAAHRMTINFDGKICEPEKYWDLSFKPDNNKKENEWIEELNFILKDSVKAHLVSDVPFGAFLSGGVDSSATVAYMAQILNNPVKTFSIGFEEENYNELKYAEIVAKRWKTEHFTEIIKPDALKILPQIVKHYGEPFGDSSAIPTYYVSKLARQNVKMVLSGDGGDELFAGYISYLCWNKYLRKDNIKSPKQLLYRIAHKALPDKYPYTGKHEPNLNNWLYFINYMNNDLRTNLWRKEYKYITNLPLDAYEKPYEQTENYTNIHKVQYMDLNTYLPYVILRKVDIVSMMHGLEVRTPFIDKKVIEFALTIPENIIFRKTKHNDWQGKLLLKKLMEKYYPKDFLYRKKMGFGLPVKEWFGQNGVLYDEIHDRLLSSNSKLNDFFEPSVIKNVIDKKYTGPTWLLLFLEEWLRQNPTK